MSAFTGGSHSRHQNRQSYQSVKTSHRGAPKSVNLPQNMQAPNFGASTSDNDARTKLVAQHTENLRPPEPKKSANVRSMISGNFMHSHISEVIPEENTNSNFETDEQRSAASNYYLSEVKPTTNSNSNSQGN